MFTHQQTFNAVVGHFLTMTHPAVIKDIEGRPTCAYRAPDGNKCFAGALIPDQEYNPGMERKGAEHPSLRALWQRLGHDSRFVVSLQNCHDRGATTKNVDSRWRSQAAQQLIAVAQRAGLTFSPALRIIAEDNSALFPDEKPSAPPLIPETRASRWTVEVTTPEAPEAKQLAHWG